MILELLTLGVALGAPASRVPDLTLESSYQVIPTPLTTEQVWVLDPDEPNPHRMRWLVNRHVDLKGFQSYQRPDGKFGVTANVLESISQGYFRGAGTPPHTMFQTIADFRCNPEPEDWFATEEGVKHAASEAIRAWDDILKIEKTKLALLLSKAEGDTSEVVRVRGDHFFQDWLKAVDSEWKVKGMNRARMAEWRYYTQAAAEAGICPGARGRALGKPVPSWREMMEPPSEGRPTTDNALGILARAPAKRWGGLFSIRANVTIGGGSLNGQFLVDSGAGMSILSPTWLEGQGILPALVEITGAAPQRVTGASFWRNGGTLARRAKVDMVEVGGFSTGLTDFLILDTDFFGPPDTMGGCCDGVLGSDFLRKFVVEFRPQSPPEIKLWPREGFNLGKEASWVEVALGPGGDPQSDCRIQSGKGGVSLRGARWDTGSEMALDVHRPWQAAAREASKASGNRWNLTCDGQEPVLNVGQGVGVSYPETLGLTSDAGPLGSRYPAFNVGMPLLARDSSFFFDLPHGRLWFNKDGLKQAVPENHSGLSLRFILVKGERVLAVAGIKPGSEAAKLAKKGLKVGSRVTELDLHLAEDLDTWDVERYLTGAYGEVLSIQWKAGAGLKMAPLKVRF